MKLEDEIQQTRFESEFQKAVLNVMVMSDRLGAASNAALKAFRISKEQYNVLRILRGQHPQASTLQSVTDRMISKSSNATRLVEKLRQRGFVKRETCPSNRRRVDISITREGLALLEELDPLVQASIARYEALTEAEAAELNRLLDKMRSVNR